jgi:hypothetical protein
MIGKDSFTMHKRRKPSRGKRKKPTSKNKLTYGIIAVALILACLLAFYLFHSKNQLSDDQTAPPEAVLIDHLSFSSPPANKTFIDQCRTILEGAGFSYTYHKGEEVTVDFYKNLPTYGYSLIILRVHSAVIKNATGDPTNLIGLFTSEICNKTTESKYSFEITQGRLARARLFTENDTYYFGITPWFVKFSMVGNFKDTVIIMMGCEGLNKTSMADALVHERKARVYISWTGPVSISHTDQSTIQLLKSLLQKKQKIRNAVQEISRDPTWQWSRLYHYPNEGDEDVGNYRIQNFIGDLTTNIAQVLPIFDKPRRSRAKLLHKSLSN